MNFGVCGASSGSEEIAVRSVTDGGSGTSPGFPAVVSRGFSGALVFRCAGFVVLWLCQDNVKII